MNDNSGVLESIRGLPVLNFVASCAEIILDNCQAARAHQEECLRLGRRCLLISAELRDRSEGMAGTGVQQAVDQACGVLAKISGRTAEWTKKGRIRKYVTDAQIAQDLANFNRDLDTYMLLFANSLLLELNKNYIVQTAHLTRLLRHGETYDAVLRQIQASPSDTRKLMRTAQEDMRQLPLNSDAYQVVQDGLYTISQKTGTLLPLIDLKGCVKKLKEEPVRGGSSSDIYIATYLGKEKVALKNLRECKTTTDRIQRFEHEATVWRDLRHDNILPCYGIASDLGQSITLVSPWMENEDVMSYISSYPDCDRRRIIRGTARGMDYLHRNNTIHGDLRGHNILIDNYGDAKICDFGLAKVHDGGTGELGSTSAAATVSRWLSPELMTGKSGLTMSSDVFSFGRTVLEILTGQKPFAYIKNGFQVVAMVCGGDEPMRPRGLEVVERGLTSEVWKFIRTTWYQEPQRRPTMASVLMQTERLLQAPTPIYLPMSTPQLVDTVMYNA